MAPSQPLSLLLFVAPERAFNFLKGLSAWLPLPLEPTQTAFVAEATQLLSERCFDVILIDRPCVNPSLIARLGAAVRDPADPPLLILELPATAGESKVLDRWPGPSIGYREDTVATLAPAVRYALERRPKERQLAHRAEHDALTGLATKTRFLNRLESALAHAAAVEESIAVLFVDLDGFKEINDTLGHHMGDGVLKQIAKRLSSRLRRGDLLARLGGDEFALALTGLAEPGDATSQAKACLNALAEPLVIEDHAVSVSASIGVSLFPCDAQDSQTLLRQADQAMYRAKAEEGSSVRMHTARVARLPVTPRQSSGQVSSLAAGFELELDLSSNRPSAARAVVLDHRGAGAKATTPVPLERTRMVGLHRWVIEQSCRALGHWLRRDGPVLPVTVELPLATLADRETIDHLRRTLAKHDLNAAWIELLVRPGWDSKGADQAGAQALEDLRRDGFGIILGDVGNTCLSLMRQVPADRVELSAGLVTRAAGDPGDAELLAHLITLVRGLGFNVGAANVRDDAQAESLTGLGCNWLAGPWLGAPLAVPDFQPHLGHWEPLRAAG